MGITVDELLGLFVEDCNQIVSLFDLNVAEEVYRGNRSGLEDYGDVMVSSIDNLDGSEILTINICL